MPDVSASADLAHGLVIFYAGTWQPVGGTSASVPMWGALIALADATAGCSSAPVGLLNPLLYDVAGQSSTDYADGFFDVLSGNNDYTATNLGRYPAAASYDMASGLGTPVAGALAAELCSVPLLKGVSPGSGSSAGGTTVTLTGERFSTAPGGTTVLFGGNPASSVQCWSTTSCSAVTPPGAGGSVPMSVVASGFSSPVENVTFTYINPPTVTSVSPSTGPSSGATQVTVTGTGFSTTPGATQIDFGNQPGFNVSCSSTTTCTVTSPAGSGTQDLLVGVSGVYSAASSADQFTYATSFDHVLVRGANGDLVEYVDDHLNGHVWNAYDHTAGTGAPAMAQGAVPAVVENPLDGLDHVYVRAANGDLQEYLDDHLNGRVWNVYDLTQSSHGLALAGDPFALLDPAQNVIHVYGRAVNGDLVEYVADGLNSRPWNAYDQGIAIAGVPDVITFGSVVHVYFQGTNADLVEYVSDHLNGRVWNAYDQSASSGYGAVTGSPAVFVVGQYVHVYVPGRGGDLVEFLNDNQNGRVWNAYDQSAGAGGGQPIVGTPSPLSFGGNLHIYTQSSSGHLVEYVDDHLNGHVWNAYDQSAGAGGGTPIVSRPLPIERSGTVHVYAQDLYSDLLEYVADHLNGHVWNAYDQSVGAGGGGHITGAPAQFPT